MKHLFSILLGTILVIFTGAIVAHAQNYAPLAPLPGTYTGAVGSETTNLGLYLSGAIKLLIALGAMLSILVAIIGGTQYVASGIAPSAKQDAKDRITNAFIGLILILTSYLILNSINPNLVAFNFNLPPIGTSPIATTTPPTGPDSAIEALNLSATAKAAAYQLKSLYPNVQFTSGRRTIDSQASAMAINTLSNRQFIAQTYTNPGPAQQLQTWLNANPTITTMADIKNGFISILNNMTPTELLGVSKHLSGNAFDVVPGDAQLSSAIQGLPGLVLFLTTEGGLTRWHAQF